MTEQYERPPLAEQHKRLRERSRDISRPNFVRRAERDRLKADNAELREALDNLQATSSSIIEGRNNIKNSLRIDYIRAFRNARAVLSKTKREAP